MNELRRKREKKQGIADTEWEKKGKKNAEEETQRQVNGFTAD